MFREIARDLGKAMHFEEGVEASSSVEGFHASFEGLPPWAVLHQLVHVATSEWYKEVDIITIAFKD